MKAKYIGDIIPASLLGPAQVVIHVEGEELEETLHLYRDPQSDACFALSSSFVDGVSGTVLSPYNTDTLLDVDDNDDEMYLLSLPFSQLTEYQKRQLFISGDADDISFDGWCEEKEEAEAEGY